MIVAALNGGLGNQLFQYAAARTLADRLSERLKLDIRELTSHAGAAHQLYRLGSYAIRASLVDRWGLVHRGFLASRKTRGFLQRAGLLRGDLLSEKGFTYQTLSAVPGHFTYLEGYWQSWRYFEEHRHRILQDLILKDPPKGRNALLLKKMSKENSVCLHVRLGDYVNSKVTSAAHGNLTLAYYQAALKRLKGAGRTYYLFSDEPKKALGLLGQGLKVQVVDHNGREPQEDLRLMSACRSFVVANSSFSWWGAWLSQRPGKKVIAPKKWFAALKHDTRDLVPADWIRL